MSVMVRGAPWSCITRRLGRDSVEHIRLYLDFDRICGGRGDATKRRRGRDTAKRGGRRLKGTKRSGKGAECVGRGGEGRRAGHDRRAVGQELAPPRDDRPLIGRDQRHVWVDEDPAIFGWHLHGGKTVIGCCTVAPLILA